MTLTSAPTAHHVPQPLLDLNRELLIQAFRAGRVYHAGFNPLVGEVSSVTPFPDGTANISIQRTVGGETLYFNHGVETLSDENIRALILRFHLDDRESGDLYRQAAALRGRDSQTLRETLLSEMETLRALRLTALARQVRHSREAARFEATLNAQGDPALFREAAQEAREQRCRAHQSGGEAAMLQAQITLRATVANGLRGHE